MRRTNLASETSSIPAQLSLIGQLVLMGKLCNFWITYRVWAKNVLDKSRSEFWKNKHFGLVWSLQKIGQLRLIESELKMSQKLILFYASISLSAQNSAYVLYYVDKMEA